VTKALQGGRNVAVSALAAYAADPEEYCEKHGQFGTDADCRRGVTAHSRAGRPGGNLASLILVICVLIGAVIACWWLGWI
jgi:hypothetical protein